MGFDLFILSLNNVNNFIFEGTGEVLLVLSTLLAVKGLLFGVTRLGLGVGVSAVGGRVWTGLGKALWIFNLLNLHLIYHFKGLFSKF